MVRDVLRKLFKCVLLALVFTGCGGGGGGPDGSYRIARDPTWAPLQLLGNETRLSAFSDELVQYIAGDEDLLVSIYTANAGSLRYLLKTGQVEGILSPLPPLPGFRDSLDFSDVYLYVGPVLIVPEASRVRSIDDMRGKIVGVQTGSSTMLVVAQIPEIVIRDYMSDSEVLGALTRGEIDGAVIPALPAMGYVRNLYEGVLKIATLPLTDDGLRLIVMRGQHEDLLEGFNEGLAALHKDGTYQKLADKWGVDIPPPPQGEDLTTL